MSKSVSDMPPPTWFPQDGPCPMCKLLGKRHESGARACDDCGEAIPVYVSMGGSGYESASPHHFHMAKINALDARQPHMRELCRECYIADYVKMFGKEPGI